jgi:hypothetical protein
LGKVTVSWFSKLSTTARQMAKPNLNRLSEALHPRAELLLKSERKARLGSYTLSSI